MTTLEARELVVLREGRRILDGATIRVRPGEAVAVQGPSGSGKSTLLYILGALEPPTSGTVTLDGRNPSLLKERELARFRNKEVGFIFQDHCLLPQCSVLENILTPTLVAAPNGNDENRARTLLADVGLGSRLDHRPAELSGGEKQRVALARALANAPEVLLLDEPTAALDPEAGERIVALLRDLRGRGLSMVMVTHVDAHARALGGTLYRCERGRLSVDA